ncbi:hypothetical protein AMS68_000014 [Peltaster fructicola]|uniref:GDP/GTP exchange factor Sec2 N-terminal domain-containing protein n=1 Tax=Peltaster fructicola TaxID=286661 RepID=A0A6H0XIF0_9PEZI|nr:hypothetical protein AMS68_000014 [Peltaster fructicola]
MATTEPAGAAWSTGIERTNDNAKHDGRHVPHDSALSVAGLSDQDHIIRELQDEVRQLAERVTSDSQRFAEYENEIRVLTAELRSEKRKQLSDTQADPITPIGRPTPPGISRFGSFIGNRKPSTPTSPNRERELEAALAQERIQRLAAEKKVNEVNGEIEELSTTLFQQANEMVSTERKENAALRERIRVLEERDAKTAVRLAALEQRDSDRKRRMEKLENAIKRIERAKALLVPR